MPMTHSIIMFGLALTLAGCSYPNRETIVSSLSQQDGVLKADIVRVKGSGLFGEKYYLQISNLRDSTVFRVNNDLLEGRNSPECGIGALRWLSHDKLFIERALDDRPHGLIYSVSGVTFERVGDSLSSVVKIH
jgi:hypothetical protein